MIARKRSPQATYLRNVSLRKTNLLKFFRYFRPRESNPSAPGREDRHFDPLAEARDRILCRADCTIPDRPIREECADHAVLPSRTQPLSKATAASDKRLFDARGDVPRDSPKRQSHAKRSRDVRRI